MKNLSLDLFLFSAQLQLVVIYVGDSERENIAGDTLKGYYFTKHGINLRLIYTMDYYYTIGILLFYMFENP